MEGKIVNIHEDKSGRYSLGVLIEQLLVVFGSNTDDLKVMIPENNNGQSFQLENGAKVDITKEVDLPEAVRVWAFIANHQYRELQKTCETLITAINASNLVSRVQAKNDFLHTD
jgi:hypothetical protein